MVRNANSMETKLTQTIIFYSLVALLDYMNFGFFNATKDFKLGFQILRTFTYSKGREQNLAIWVSSYEWMTYGS